MHESRRYVSEVFHRRGVTEGAGVRLQRVFGYHQVPKFDPFLLLDDFSSDDPEDYVAGFPPHPHRGIETITYLKTGTVEHGDSLGNNGVIGPGDCQWMSSGSGIIHKEMPKGDERGRMHGFQLWANMPSDLKMSAPAYRDIRSDTIPRVVYPEGTTVNLIAGDLSGIRGPYHDSRLEPEYFDVFIPPQSTFSHSLEHSHTAFAYIYEGQGLFCEEDGYLPEVSELANYTQIEKRNHYSSGELLLFSKGLHISVRTEKTPMRFLFVSGKPLHEPISWYGPMVMNTKSQIMQALNEYHSGTFLKHST